MTGEGGSSPFTSPPSPTGSGLKRHDPVNDPCELCGVAPDDVRKLLDVVHTAATLHNAVDPGMDLPLRQKHNALGAALKNLGMPLK